MLRTGRIAPEDPVITKGLTFLEKYIGPKGGLSEAPHSVYTTSVALMAFHEANRKAGGRYDRIIKGSQDFLKSMIYAGLTQDDVRVKAAIAYIKKNYTLEENPGQGQRGLYYYYQTFAKAMALLGSPTLVDAQGTSHDWRAELIAALAKRQAANGSWVNPVDRFMEGDPNIATSFALLALANARARG